MKDEALRLDNQLCFLLYGASRAVTQIYGPLLEPLGLTYPQYLVLLVLWESEVASVRTLCDRLYLDSGTLTPLLSRLEAAGLVRRVRSTEDARVVDIHLTPAGKRLKRAARAVPEALCVPPRPLAARPPPHPRRSEAASSSSPRRKRHEAPLHRDRIGHRRARRQGRPPTRRRSRSSSAPRRRSAARAATPPTPSSSSPPATPPASRARSASSRRMQKHAVDGVTITAAVTLGKADDGKYRLAVELRGRSPAAPPTRTRAHGSGAPGVPLLERHTRQHRRHAHGGVMS